MNPKKNSPLSTNYFLVLGDRPPPPKSRISSVSTVSGSLSLTHTHTHTHTHTCLAFLSYTSVWVSPARWCALFCRSLLDAHRSLLIYIRLFWHTNRMSGSTFHARFLHHVFVKRQPPKNSLLWYKLLFIFAGYQPLPCTSYISSASSLEISKSPVRFW